MKDPLPLYFQAGIQDQLLQSYRGFQLTTQSIFLAIGVITTLFNLLIPDFHTSIWIFCLFGMVGVFALYCLIKFRNVIRSRALDVDYWQMKIMEMEQASGGGPLTDFKLYQKGRNKGHIADSDAQPSQLIEKGKGHTRKVIDTYLTRGFMILWLLLLIVSVINLLNDQ